MSSQLDSGTCPDCQVFRRNLALSYSGPRPQPREMEHVFAATVERYHEVGHQLEGLCE